MVRLTWDWSGSLMHLGFFIWENMFRNLGNLLIRISNAHSCLHIIYFHEHMEIYQL